MPEVRGNNKMITAIIFAVGMFIIVAILGTAWYQVDKYNEKLEDEFDEDNLRIKKDGK